MIKTIKIFDHIIQIILVVLIILQKKEYDYNYDFYTNCDLYFSSLRKHNKHDYDFEDEFYYTLPGSS